jgi:hypothetical protein
MEKITPEEEFFILKRILLELKRLVETITKHLKSLK